MFICRTHIYFAVKFPTEMHLGVSTFCWGGGVNCAYLNMFWQLQYRKRPVIETPFISGTSPHFCREYVCQRIVVVMIIIKITYIVCLV